jgi:FYVE zinc finger
MASATIVRDMPPPPEEERPLATSQSSSSPESPTAQGNAPTSKPDGNTSGGSSAQNEVIEHSVATLSNPWEYDLEQPQCAHCRDDFNLINRRHHCRLCGKVFCGRCSDQRALIPPSAIVLTPKAGKKALPPNLVNRHNTGFHLPSPQEQQQAQQAVSFSPDEDPDRMLTYVDDEQQLLYGKGLEERFHLAREPLRVCLSCHEQLQPLQEELRSANSNAMRFNYIDPTDPFRRFLNSPLAFTLGHEVRKAAYALNNLLPMPKRMGSVVEAVSSDYNNPDSFLTGDARELQQCRDECSMIAPNFSNLDGVRIPARMMEQAKGVAVMTVVKGGFGLAGLEFGTGLVVARLAEDQWSAPLAIGTAGLSWGGE